jgi:AcrR family transcriptional regulator
VSQQLSDQESSAKAADSLDTAGKPLHQVILDVTRRLLVEKGDPDKVSIAAICALAQCTPPSIYHYYPTKQVLLRTASNIGFKEFMDSLDVRSADADNGLDEILLRMHAYLDWGLDNPAEYRVLLRRRLINNPAELMAANGQPELRLNTDTSADPNGGPGAAPIEEQPITVGLGRLQEAIVRAQQEGSLPDCDIKELTLIIWGLIHGLTMLGIANPGLSRQLLHESLTRLPALICQNR